jgi:hypothetical protein
MSFSLGGKIMDPISSFWIAFWPNFYSTCFGVIAAFILAIISDRIITWIQNIKKRDEEQKELQQALKLLLKAFEWNQGQLESLARTMETKKYLKISLLLDLSTWDTLKTTIFKDHKNLGFYYRMGEYFLNLKYLGKTYDKYFSYFVNVNDDSQIINELRISTSNYLLEISNDLVIATKKLHSEIEQEMFKVNNKVDNHSRIENILYFHWLR